MAENILHASQYGPFGNGSELSLEIWAVSWPSETGWRILAGSWVPGCYQTVLNLTQCLCHEANNALFLSLI